MLNYSNFRDMIDGGGAGRSGDRFEGGLLSDALNASGIRPAGYRARQRETEQDQPQRVSAPQYRTQPAPQAQPQVAPDYSVAPYASPQMMPQVQQATLPDIPILPDVGAREATYGIPVLMDMPPAPQIGLLSPVGAREATYGIPAMMQMPQEPQMRDVRQMSNDPQFQDYMRDLQMFNRMYGVY